MDNFVGASLFFLIIPFFNYIFSVSLPFPPPFLWFLTQFAQNHLDSTRSEHYRYEQTNTYTFEYPNHLLTPLFKITGSHRRRKQSSTPTPIFNTFPSNQKESTFPPSATLTTTLSSIPMTERFALPRPKRERLVEANGSFFSF